MGFINRPSCNDRVQVRKRLADCSRLANCTFVCNVLVFTPPVLWGLNTWNQDHGDPSLTVQTVITPGQIQTTRLQMYTVSEFSTVGRKHRRNPYFWVLFYWVWKPFCHLVLSSAAGRLFLRVRMCVLMNTDGLACWWLRWVLKPPPPSSLWSLILSLCSRLWTERGHTLKIVLLLCISVQLMIRTEQNRNTAMECKGWYWSVLVVWYLYFCVSGRNQHKCIWNPFLELCVASVLQWHI